MISVVTPTWQRHEILLQRCVPSVQRQDYLGRIEQVVVSDGPDPELEEQIRILDDIAWHPFVFDQLPEHDPARDFGNRPRLRALELVHGEYIAYLDDDNAYLPHHISLLADALNRSGADFVYSSMLRHWPDGHTDVVGSSPPTYSHIDTSLIMHRRSLLEKATWQVSQRPDPDWGIVACWLEAGATWEFVPVITVDYYRRSMGFQ